MNQTQALAKLKKLIGPKLGYRVNPKAPNAMQREALRIVFQEMSRDADEAEAARRARYNEVLRNDGLYQELKLKAAAAREAKEIAGAGMYRKRITVGVNGSIFFHVKADGDTWAEVVETVEGLKQ